jgi:hypothetical protein
VFSHLTHFPRSFESDVCAIDSILNAEEKLTKRKRDGTLKFHTLAKCIPPPHDTGLYNVREDLIEMLPG